MHESKASSSVLDSYSEESAESFENSLSNEDSSKRNEAESSAWHFDASLEGGFNIGIAKAEMSASFGIKGESSSAREDITKNTMNALNKHSQKASSKRDVQVNTSYENKQEAGEETSTERIIENINLSRTLNFVFRQMNQEFISILHLIDAKIAFTTGLPGSYKESNISNMDSFLKEVLKNQGEQSIQLILSEAEDMSIRDFISKQVLEHLSFIIDYNDKPRSFVEKRTHEYDNHEGELKTVSYWRTLKTNQDTYVNEATGTTKEVLGIIVSASTNVMRTEGIIVDALLGQGDALDAYSHGLQDEAVRSKQIENEVREAEIAKMKLANEIIKNEDDAKAKLFEQIYPTLLKNQTNSIVVNPED